MTRTTGLALESEPDDVVEGRSRLLPSGSRHRSLARWSGAVLALLLAGVLFSQFSLDAPLSRDESIYIYGGQQLAERVPPYVSIFDPKTPLSTLVAGGAVATARALERDEIKAIRVVFFVFACAAALAVYLLALGLFDSTLAALASVATFVSFEGFALDALTGPNPKTLGVLLAVLSLALLIRRRIFWAAFTASLAFLVWQPLLVYVALTIGVSILEGRKNDGLRPTTHALAGALVPIAATSIYFWLADALDDLIDAGFVYPVTHQERADDSLTARTERIVSTVNREYGDARILIWAGLGLLLAFAAIRVIQRQPGGRIRLLDDRHLLIVVSSFLAVAAFSLFDFQGYPDLYPALPYAAIGIGGLVALVSSRLEQRPLRVAAAGTMAAVVTLGLFTFCAYAGAPQSQAGLLVQRERAAKVQRLLGRAGTLYVFGDPRPLVLTERRNPSRYIFLNSGIDQWVIDHTPGGLAGWQTVIAAVDPEVVIVNRWISEHARTMSAWLLESYVPRRVQGMLLFVDPQIRDRRVGAVVGEPDDSRP